MNYDIVTFFLSVQDDDDVIVREDADWIPPSDASCHESSSEHSSDEDMCLSDSEVKKLKKANILKTLQF